VAEFETEIASDVSSVATTACLHLLSTSLPTAYTLAMQFSLFRFALFSKLAASSILSQYLVYSSKTYNLDVLQNAVLINLKSKNYPLNPHY
jgi:hypothetical protein